MRSLPDTLTAGRLTFRRPRRRDAAAVFAAYASDPEVTRHLTWRTHRSLADTHAFLDASDRGWSTGSDRPYLAWMGTELVGSTGLTRVGPGRVRTGYLVRRDRWGEGLAGEMLRTMTDLAFARGVATAVEALVDPEHVRSRRVLEREGFHAVGEATGVHPNLGPETRVLVRYLRLKDGSVPPAAEGQAGPAAAPGHPRPRPARAPQP
jgi:RimJ/RimL family protein N-acetyltransferase